MISPRKRTQKSMHTICRTTTETSMHGHHKSVYWNCTHRFVENLARAQFDTQSPLHPVASCELAQLDIRRGKPPRCVNLSMDLFKSRNTAPLLRRYTVSVQNITKHWTRLPTMPTCILNDKAQTIAMLCPTSGYSTAITDLTDLRQAAVLNQPLRILRQFHQPTTRPATASANTRRDVCIRYTNRRCDSQICANAGKVATCAVFKLEHIDHRHAAPISYRLRQ